MNSAISHFIKRPFKKISKLTHILVIVNSVLIILILGPYLFYTINFMGRIYPNIYISGFNVGGMTEIEAVDFLSLNTSNNFRVTLTSNSKEFILNTTDIDLSYNYYDSVNRAFNITRTGNFTYDTLNRISLILKPREIGLSTIFNENKFSNYISNIGKDINVEPIFPTIEIINNDIQIHKGEIGKKADLEKLRYDIGSQIAFNKSVNIPIFINSVDPRLDNSDIPNVKTRAEKYLGEKILYKTDDVNFELETNDIIKLINPYGGYYDTEINNLIEQIELLTNREPQTPKFVFNGAKVTEFAPALSGIKVNTESLKKVILSDLHKLESEDNLNLVSNIPTDIKEPAITTGQINNLGIKELIGHGTSTYYHSIPGRVFNVNLAASRINGSLVAPGETFSFNKILGDVSKLTGYKEAYIISGGRTVLGDGGGVCQVSTTLFRAVMNAGLPVNDRSAHAYRVGYYEQGSPPGMDATVYYPTTDFKFTNDTENYILIQAKNNPSNYSLDFDLYGTSDGRVSNITKPVVSNYSAPLPTVYQDDPTLPNGTLKQVDYAAAGSRITFNYSVIKNGVETYKRTFVSNYQPWATVYLRGTKI